MSAPPNLADLSPEQKRALLAQLLRKNVSQPALVYPLSHGQRALWFLYQIAPESPAYNAAFAARIHSAVDATALRRAFQFLVDRHPSLRCTFGSHDGKLVHRVHEHLKAHFEETDASTLSPDELHALVLQAYTRPFVLEQGPVLRVHLFTQSAEEHILLLTVPHIANDFWSILILLDELRVLYPAIKAGAQAALPPLNFQYADYVRWQTEMLESEEGERLWQYWQTQLGGELPTLNLFTDRPRAAVQSFHGATHLFEINEELTRGLKALAEAEGATLYMVVMAALQTLLHRYSGQDDILVGSPAIGQSRIRFKGVVGYFINAIVLRADLSGNPTFKEFLGQVRRTVLAALKHQDYPFPLIVQRLQPKRSLDRAPIYQVLFVLQPGLVPGEKGFRVDLGGLELETYPLNQQEGQTDLHLEMTEVSGSIFSRLKYDTDLFDASTIERLAGNLRTLLHNIIAHPDWPLSDLHLLTPAEHQLLLSDFNDTDSAFPLDLCFHQLFQAQVLSCPDATAVSSTDRQLSYSQLNARANRLARLLFQLGVGPEVLVGVLADRSIELLVLLLSIFKAGGAYLPLDPFHPVHRHRQLLKLSGATVIVAERRFLPLLKLAVEQRDNGERLPHLLCLEELFEQCTDAAAGVDTSDAFEGETAAEPESEANLPPRSQPENLAYVIFTSGSTGQPKGVMIEQRAMLNHLWIKASTLQLTPQDIVAQTASQCFDISVWQMFAALLVGARVEIMTDEVAHDPWLLMEAVEQSGATVLEGVPSFLRMLIQHVSSAQGEEPIPDGPAARGIIAEQRERQALRSLRWLLATGEALPPQLCRQWLRLYPQIPIVNAYGPTECADDVSQAVIGEAPAEQVVRMTIGSALSNLQLYVLDEEMEPVPIGVAGELYVGGVGVGRGYLHDGRRTAERYVPDLFGMRDGGRLYRTGDMVRRLEGGELEYVQRMDDQVKVRGYRIELGEIEAVLEQHERVREAVVVAREGAGGEKQLVGYVVGTEGGGVSVRELQRYVREHLPEYMVPAAIMELKQLPLTSNGKVDRKGLPEVEHGEEERARGYVPPRDEREQALAKILSEVLGVERIGIYDNFFELGGDSILSIQAISKARQAGLHLSPRDLFQHQCIAELAAVVATAKEPLAEQGPVSGLVALTPIQRFFFQHQPSAPHHYNQAILLEVLQRLDPALLAQVVRRLVAHHDALRLRFRRITISETSTAPDTTVWQQENLAEEMHEVFTYRDLSELAEAERRAAIEDEAAQAQTSLNLSEGPLLRVVYFDCGGESNGRLLWVIHHLAVDGVSWRILLEDFEQAYAQVSRGEATTLPAKTSSFKQWAERLVEHARSVSIRGQLDYWRDTMQGNRKGLPVDRQAGENTLASAQTIEVRLSAEETRQLLQEVRNAYRTQVIEVLLTALAGALCEWSGERRALVDVEGHGRADWFEEVDVTRTVGWFTVLYPVALTIEKESVEGEALKAVKEQVRGVPEGGMGYGLLRYMSEEADVRAEMAGLTPAQVSFNYLGRFDQLLSDSAPFRLLVNESGASFSGQTQRPYLLDINTVISEGQFRAMLTYSENIHERATIERLAESYVTALRRLIAHCRTAEAGGYTPSDFPLAKLRQPELDMLIAADRQIEDIYPLSPTQQGILFHNLYAPEAGVYFQQINCSIQADLNLLAFEQAWQEVVDRHPVLRTAFAWENLEEPLQIVRRQVRAPLDQQDWRGLDPDRQQEQLDGLLKANRRHGFDLSQSPLIRLALIRMADEVYKLIWSHHHLLLDGWCVSVLLKEIFTCYEALRQGRKIHLERNRPYADFIAWLQRQDLSQAEVFWRETLKGIKSPTPLVLARANGNVLEHEAGYGERQIELPAVTTRAFQTLAREHQLTLNTMMQGVWALLLSYYSGEADVVFGETAAGRPTALEGVETMIGLFINTLPVRVQVTPDESFVSWLQKLQKRQAEVRQYEHSPLYKVQGWSEIPRGLPLFESILTFENYPLDESLKKGSTSVEVKDVRVVDFNHYPLSVSVIPGSLLTIRMTYDLRRFDVAAVNRMLGHFEMLLGSIVAYPDARLHELAAKLAEADRQQQALKEQLLEKASMSRLRKRRRQSVSESQLRTADSA